MLLCYVTAENVKCWEIEFAELRRGEWVQHTLAYYIAYLPLKMLNEGWWAGDDGCLHLSASFWLGCESIDRWNNSMIKLNEIQFIQHFQFNYNFPFLIFIFHFHYPCSDHYMKVESMCLMYVMYVPNKVQFSLRMHFSFVSRCQNK